MVAVDPYVDEVELELLVVDSLCVKELLLLFDLVVELEIRFGQFSCAFFLLCKENNQTFRNRAR